MTIIGIIIAILGFGLLSYDISEFQDSDHTFPIYMHDIVWILLGLMFVAL